MSKFIDAEKFYAKIKNHQPLFFAYADRMMIKELLDEEPEADVTQEVHAHWIGIRRITPISGASLFQYQCSNCKLYTDYQENYCPHCGAKMDEVKE